MDVGHGRSRTWVHIPFLGPYALVLTMWFLPCRIFPQTYFQQRVDHTIAVSLDDARHMLHGTGSFTYTNHSPQRLDTLWIHLWANAYRDKGTALCRQMDRNGDLSLHFATEEDRGWIDSLAFQDPEGDLIWGYHDHHPDIAWVKLRHTLDPEGSVVVSTPFRVKIPDGKFSRLGHTGQAYYVTQWYPKPAVYDATGWHAMPYLTLGEFYNEYGRFDVSITLPANYVVGATGILQENEEENAFLEARAASPLVVDRSKEGNEFPASDARYKTVRFVQDSVHDFAWFADKRFQVRKGSVLLPESGRSVTTWALFTARNAALWENAVEYLNESVLSYSRWVGEYPYAACTAVDGTISAGGGMEYPMITIIGNMSDAMGLDNVIAHEVGHNWFQGMLGSNERDHAWMDEGVNSFIELRYMRERYPSGGFSFQIPFMKKLAARTQDAHRYQSELGYRLNARRNLDQAVSTPSADLTEINYGTMVYMKTALIMDHLMAYLGEETMDRCMHAYFEEWKFKHPQPEDMRAVFERESGQNLGWVFDEYIPSTRKFDFTAKHLRSSEDGSGALVSLLGRGLHEAPVPLTAFAGKDVLGTLWVKDSGHEDGAFELPWPNVDRIRIDATIRTLDIDRRNNEIRSQGLMKRWKAPALEPFLGIEHDDRSSIYYAPAIAWNGHDGFQAGLLLHNTTFPSQRTEWVVAPLYAFGSERVVGAARIEHHFDRIRGRILQNIHLGLSGRSASTFHDHYRNAWFTKLQPSITFDLKRDPLTRPWEHSVSVRAISLHNEEVHDPPGEIATRSSSSDEYAELSYTMRDRNPLAPTFISPSITYHADFLRLSLDVSRCFTFNERKDQFRARAFIGTFLSVTDAGLSDGLQAWGLTWGPEDMLFDNAYLERGATEGFTSQQFSKQQGAFKTPFLQGGSDSWIAAVNTELDLPIGIPLSLFASAGFVPFTTSITQGGSTTVSTSTASYYEAGIGLQLIRDVVEVWFPLYVSDRIKEEEEVLDRGIGDRIRFVFALERMDPTRALRKIQP